MTHTQQVAYAVAGACFAAILSFSTNPEWWEAHPITSALLGASMPLCILGAWMSNWDLKERKALGIKFVPHSPKVMKIAAWGGISIGLFSLTLFLASISYYIAIGFFTGGIILGFFADIHENKD